MFVLLVSVCGCWFVAQVSLGRLAWLGLIGMVRSVFVGFSGCDWSCWLWLLLVGPVGLNGRGWL